MYRWRNGRIDPSLPLYHIHPNYAPKPPAEMKDDQWSEFNVKPIEHLNKPEPSNFPMKTIAIVGAAAAAMYLMKK